MSVAGMPPAVGSAPIHSRAELAYRRIAFALVGLAIAFGVFARVYDLGHRVFWTDEVFSVIRARGLSEGQLVREAARAHTARQVRALVLGPVSTPFRVAAPGLIAGLAAEEPQHPPAYFMLLNLWAGIVGFSVTQMRVLSAAIGILSLAAMWWLTFELCKSRFAAAVATAMLAVSPLAVFSSQAIREYSLWILMILVSGALLVRAVERPSPLRWVLYALAMAFAIYTYLGSYCVMLGHIAYAFVMLRHRTRELVSAAAAMLLGAACGLPWLAVVAMHSSHVRGIFLTPTTQAVAADSGRGVIRAAATLPKWDFLNLNLWNSTAINSLLVIPAFVVCVAALIITWRLCSERVRTFVLWSVLAGIVPYISIALASHTVGLILPRYFFGFFIGINLAIATAVAALTARRRWAFALAAIVCIAAARITQVGLELPRDSWWNSSEEQSIAVSSIVDRSKAPVLIGDNDVADDISLASYLRPQTRMELSPRCYLCRNAPEERLDPRMRDGDEVFLLGASDGLTARLRASRPARRLRCIEVIIVMDGCRSGDIKLFRWGDL